MRLKTIYTISVILTYTETFRREKSEAGTKVLASQLFLDFRARRSGGVGSTTLISSAFTALLNCAEVGRRNRILTNYRFLSHSHSGVLGVKQFGKLF